MLRIAPQIVTLASPLWVAAASAALLAVIACALALGPRRKGVAAAAARLVLIVIGAALCGSLTWAFFDSAALRERSAERDALAARAGELTAQSLAPGSPLACLDAVAGDTVQAACEAAVFASPANVASAISYVAAQFALLSDMTEYAERGGTGIDGVLLPLRHALEADPFGLLAHVLVRRDSCSSENCPPLALLRDPNHVRTNMIAQTLQHYVDHYREVWARSPDVPVADASAMAEANAPGRRKVPLDIDFPTAASIPPISIMNPEKRTAPEPRAASVSGHEPAQTDPVWTPVPAQRAQ